jgi:hypothetical protein
MQEIEFQSLRLRRYQMGEGLRSRRMVSLRDMSERTNGSSLAFAYIYALGLLAIAT